MTDELEQWEEFLDRAEILEKTMIGGEKIEDYEVLLRGLYEEYAPRGTSEEDEVFKLADLKWRRKRLDHKIQIKLFRQLLHNQSANKILTLRQLRLLGPEFLKAKTDKEVEFLLGVLDPHVKKGILRRIPPKKYKQAGEWGSAIAQYLSWVPEEILEIGEEFFRKHSTIDKAEHSTIDKAEYSTIDEDYATLERIDASIDRMIKRLMQLKTMKQMFRQLEPKVVESSVTKKLIENRMQ